MRTLIALACGFGALAAACGNANFAGTYAGTKVATTAQGVAATNPVPIQITLTLSQTGSNLTGSSNVTVSGSLSALNITGTVNGSVATITSPLGAGDGSVSYPDCTVTLQGSPSTVLTLSGSTLSGTENQTAPTVTGVGCPAVGANVWTLNLTKQ